MNDPVRISVYAANKIGIEPFISYRMNDHHFLNFEDAFIHPEFWKKNPQFWISESNRYFNYINPEVRDYYFSFIEEFVDMVNVSSFFVSSPQIDAEGHKKWVKNSPIYGEMHFICHQCTQQDGIYNGFYNNVSRKCTKEMYRVLAANYLDRGMDGISFSTLITQGIIILMNQEDCILRMSSLL